MRHRARRLLLVLALAAAPACSDPFAPVRPDALISLYVDRLPSSTELHLPLRLRVSFDGRSHEVVVDSALWPHDLEFRADRDGMLVVRLDLVDAGGDTVATNVFRQRFTAGNTNYVSGYVGGPPSCFPSVCDYNGPQTRLTDSVSLYVGYGSVPKGFNY